MKKASTENWKIRQILWKRITWDSEKICVQVYYLRQEHACKNVEKNSPSTKQNSKNSVTGFIRLNILR